MADVEELAKRPDMIEEFKVKLTELYLIWRNIEQTLLLKDEAGKFRSEINPECGRLFEEMATLVAK